MLLLATAHGGSAAGEAAAARRSPSNAASASQVIRIDVKGALAHVTVVRTLTCKATPPGDAILDIALPEPARLLDVSIGDGPRLQVTRPVAATKARDAYWESLRTFGVVANERPFEDEARFRIHVACTDIQVNKYIHLEYTFILLLEVQKGHAVVAFPQAAELAPPAARVEVRTDPSLTYAEVSIAGAVHAAHGPATVVDTVSTRAPWTVSLLPRGNPARIGEATGRLVALTSTAPRHGQPLLFAYALGALRGPRRALPERVLFLIDRSRSVGPGGLEAEREVARRLLEALPPTTRFDALFFDRTPKRLFPLARAATREAITALEDEMVPARLANGTDLPVVLRAAADLLKREVSEFSPGCLLVLLTDGAVGAPPAANNLPALLALAPAVPIELAIAAVSVRPVDDPPVSPAERRVLQSLAASATLGGVERVLKTPDIADVVPALLDDLRGGGDVHGIWWGTDRHQGLVEVIPPGAGASGVLSSSDPKAYARPAGSRALGYRGLRRPLSLRSTTVDAHWMIPLMTSRASPADTRLLIGPGLSCLVEPVVRPAISSHATDGNLNPAGYMERSVVRDALSLAFTPRARACYLNRSAKTAAERDLTGRVRLALDLTRGEVAGVRIESSTLDHQAIESCLREAAYAIEVPRAYRNDDAVTAVLNLVFRPRTPEAHSPAPENPSISHEIDMLVEAALKAPDDAGPPALPAAAPAQAADAAAP